MTKTSIASSGIDCNLIPSQTRGASLGWVVGPVVAGIGLALLVVFVIVFKRKRQPLKQPMDGGQVTTPLMSGFDMANASVIAPSDPVELRRMNFQVFLTLFDSDCRKLGNTNLSNKRNQLVLKKYFFLQF